MTRVAIYARVSTSEQTTENQMIRLREYCNYSKWEYEEFKDEGISGKTMNRPELQRMMSELYKFDGVAVLRLDRLGRSVINLKNLIEKIRGEGKFFIAVDQGIKISPDKNDPMSGLLLNMLAAIAEFEREIIVERVNDGLNRARLQGKRIGRPSVLSQKGISEDHIIGLKKEGKSIREISQIVGIKKGTIRNILVKNGYVGNSPEIQAD